MMKSASAKWLLPFWLISYLTVQAAVVWSYHYGRELPRGAWLGWAPIAGALAIGWLIIAFVIMPTRPAIRSGIAALVGEVGQGRAIVVAALAVIGWVWTPSRDWLRPGFMTMVLYLVVNLMGFILLLILLQHVSYSVRLAALARQFHGRLMRLRSSTLLVSASVWCFAASLLLCYGVLRPIPHVWDEAAYVFQARIFAEGHLTSAPTPAGPSPILRTYFTWDQPRGYSVFPPGWAAVLAAGVAVGWTWLVNPLLAGTCVPLLYLFVREVWGPGRARYAVLLLCVCPFFLCMSASLMAHTLSLLAALLAGVGFLRGRQSWPLAAVGGLGLATLFLTRPLEGALFACFFSGLFLRNLVRHCEGFRRAVFFLVACIGPLLWMGFNRAVGSGPLDVPVDRYFEQTWGVSNQLGFGANRGLADWFHYLGPGHSPLEGLYNLQFNFHSANEKLWGWPGGAAIVLALGLVARRGPRIPRGVLALSLMLIAAYGLYWYHGECLGPRFYFVLLPVMILLTYRGLSVLGRALHTTGLTVAATLVPFTFLVHIPRYGLTHFQNMRGISAQARDAVRDPPERPAIVLVDDADPHHYFFCAVQLNDPDLKNDVLFALDRDRSEDIEALRRAYPDRHLFRFRGGAWERLATSVGTPGGGLGPSARQAPHFRAGF